MSKRKLKALRRLCTVVNSQSPDLKTGDFKLKGASVIKASKANYIKLGEKGSYEKYCFENGVIALGFYEVPHEEKFDPKTASVTYKNLGCSKGTCTSYATQMLLFYNSTEDTLWFTIADGKLWWCFAKPVIKFIGNDKTLYPNGSRHLETIHGWSDKDLKGNPLFLNELNGNLTKISGYQGTICKLDYGRLDYLLRRINGEELSEIIEARKNRHLILESISAIMKLLNPKDFELLVELVFAQSGWQRLGISGGTQKTTDIEMYLPSTGEYAFAQVKSETDQKQLEKYEEAAEARDDKYMFYVYHTCKQQLKISSEKTKLIDANKLSEMILNAGLFDWLLKKAK